MLIAERVEDVIQKARPEASLYVLPGVELDLLDLLPERDLGLRTVGDLLLDRVHAVSHRVHEEALAAAPVTEQPDGERRPLRLGSEQVGERIDLATDADEIVARADAICGVRGDVDGAPRELLLEHRAKRLAGLPPVGAGGREPAVVQPRERRQVAAGRGEPVAERDVHHRLRPWAQQRSQQVPEVCPFLRQGGEDALDLGRERRRVVRWDETRARAEVVDGQRRVVARQQVATGDAEVREHDPRLAVTVRVRDQQADQQVLGFDVGIRRSAAQERGCVGVPERPARRRADRSVLTRVHRHGDPLAPRTREQDHRRWAAAPASDGRVSCI